MGTGFFGDHKNVLKLLRGSGCTHCEYTKCRLIFMFKWLIMTNYEFHQIGGKRSSTFPVGLGTPVPHVPGRQGCCC